MATRPLFSTPSGSFTRNYMAELGTGRIPTFTESFLGAALNNLKTNIANRQAQKAAAEAERQKQEYALEQIRTEQQQGLKRSIAQTRAEKEAKLDLLRRQQTQDYQMLLNILNKGGVENPESVAAEIMYLQGGGYLGSRDLASTLHKPQKQSGGGKKLKPWRDEFDKLDDLRGTLTNNIESALNSGILNDNEALIAEALRTVPYTENVWDAYEKAKVSLSPKAQKWIEGNIVTHVNAINYDQGEIVKDYPGHYKRPEPTPQPNAKEILGRFGAGTIGSFNPSEMWNE